MALGKHLVQALPSMYTLQCLTGKVDNNNDMYLDAVALLLVYIIPNYIHQHRLDTQCRVI